MAWFRLLLCSSFALLFLLRDCLLGNSDPRAIVRVAFDECVIDQSSDSDTAVGVGVRQVAADQMMLPLVPTSHRAFAAHRRIQIQKSAARIARYRVLYFDDFGN